MSKKKITIIVAVLGLLVALLFTTYYCSPDYVRRVVKTTSQSAKNIKDAIYQPDFQITHGPYICSMTENGDLYVVWTTNRPAVSWVELTSEATGETVEVYETRSGLNRSSKTLHTVKLSKLLPDAKYTYHVHSRENKEFKYTMYIDYGDHVSSQNFRDKPYEFKTFSDSANHSSFVVFNDIHGGNQTMRKLSEGVDYKDYDFVMLNGDMTEVIMSEEFLFSEYIDTSAELFGAETPIIWGRGNHDTYGAHADYLLDYFPNVYNEFYYLFTVGDVAYLVLDAAEYVQDSYWDWNNGEQLAQFEPYRDEEAKWISKIIETDKFKNASQRIVFLHIPPLYGAYHTNKELYEKFVPILQNANIDLMISGHDHVYAYYPANDSINYPIIVNDNKSLLKCDVTKDKIQVSIIDSQGGETIEHLFEKDALVK